MNNSFVCLLIIVVAASTSLAQSGIMHMCGSRIPEALSLVCENYYQSPYKKGGQQQQQQIQHLAINSVDFKEPKLDEYAKWQVLNEISKENEEIRSRLVPFQDRFESLGLLKTRFRRSPGIVEECCYKGCTYDEMKEYCG